MRRPWRSISLSLALMVMALTPIGAQEKPVAALRVHLRDVPLATAVEFLNELGHSNITVSHAATANRVSVDLRHVSADAVVETLARNAGLWYRRDPSGVVRLMTRRELQDDWMQVRDAQLRSFAIAYPSARSIAEQIAQLYGARVAVASVSDRTVWTGASDDAPQSGSDGSGSRNEGGLQTSQVALAQEQAIRLTVDEASNRLLVRSGDQQAIQEIADLIATLDRPIAQVLLEVKILEVLLRDGQETSVSINFSDAAIASPTTATAVASGPGGLLYSYLDRRLDISFTAMQEEGRVSSISTPVVLAANNRESVIQIGERRPIFTNIEIEEVQNTVGETVLTRSIAVPGYEQQTIGTTLTIRPRINDQGTVTLEIDQETSSVNVAGATIQILVGSVLQTLTVDTVQSSSIEGTVIARDGLAVMLGGLVRERLSDRTTKVPILGSIPLIGFLFRDSQTVQERIETVLIIRPHILDDISTIEEERLRDRLRHLSRHPWHEMGDDALDVFGDQASPRRSQVRWYVPVLAPVPGNLP
ncbi:MAG: type II secretion system protein GspD [Planctomycetota bacterium]|nr:MAG: type II secretion system protein GspD [Planctomycetota bacterium]